MAAFWQIVKGRSMEPALVEGDEVLLCPLAGAPSKGDVVVVRGGSGLVLHRVVHATGVRIVTRGDACRRDDPAVAPGRVLLRALERRRDGRAGAIPPPPGALRRLGSRLAGRLRGALRWDTITRGSPAGAGAAAGARRRIASTHG
jgi:hypothetical protein